MVESTIVISPSPLTSPSKVSLFGSKLKVTLNASSDEVYAPI
jgi:hypothetical protein